MLILEDAPECVRLLCTSCGAHTLTIPADDLDAGHWLDCRACGAWTRIGHYLDREHDSLLVPSR